jgi:hypothetical protein
MGKEVKTSRQIIAETAEKHRITVADLVGRCQQRWAAWPRQEAMFRMFVECRHLSLPQIGRALGDRDHTTVIHGIERHAKRQGVDYDLLRRVVGRPDCKGGERNRTPRRNTCVQSDYFRHLASDYGFVMHEALHHGR